MNVFLDCEFTSLTQSGRLMSLALIAEDGRFFYCELNDYRPVEPWIEHNVEAFMFIDDVDALRAYAASLGLAANGSMVMLGAGRDKVAPALVAWLGSLQEQSVVWSDVLAYDWLHFCELFGGAMRLPGEVYYIPFDVSTLLLERGHDPDVNREAFAGMESIQARKHNALWDAVVLKEISRKLGLPTHGRFTDISSENQTPG